MKRVKSAILVALGGVLGCLLLLLCGLELAYHHAVSGLEPLPTIGRVAPLPPKVATALWVSEAKCKPGLIPRIYAWNVHRLFGDRDRSRLLASHVARPIAARAHERGQTRGMLDWHLKWFVVTIWVTRNLSTNEILATNANEAWMGEFGRGFAEGAHRLFGKKLAELDYPDIALLVAISRNPDSYNPLRRPRRAMEWRNRILQMLFEVGIISEGDLSTGQSAPLGIRISSS